MHHQHLDLGGWEGGVSVAILGYPNVGKSSLFNTLTKGHVEVANWPGTTVEIGFGRVKVNGLDVVFYDLPGVYGLSGSGVLESTVKRFLLERKPDVALVLVDSTNVERSLSLAIQVMEVHDNVILALTKLDMAHDMGIHVNTEGLSRALGVSVIPVSIVWGLGVKEVVEAVREALGKRGKHLNVDYGVLEPYIEELAVDVSKLSLEGLNPRWVAVKLLEGDGIVEDIVMRSGGASIVEKARRARIEITSSLGRDPAALASEYRSRYALRVARENVVRVAVQARRESYLSTLDMLFLNPKTSLVVTMALLSTIFLLVFTVNTGFPLNILLELAGFSGLAELVEQVSLSGLTGLLLDSIAVVIEDALKGAPEWFTSFIVEGVVGGFAAVVVLVPLIFTAAVMVAILEDVGLLPRIAVGAHRGLCKVGFSGHTILPLTLCLGCNVAGIVSTRGIPGYWDRFKMYLLAPLIPCQARLVVLIVLASVIGGLLGALALVSVYVLSILLLSLLSLLLDRALRVRVKPELLLEIPRMHKPIGKVVWWISWSRVKHYLVKAGTIIFLGSIATWILTHTTTSLNYTGNPAESIAGVLAQRITPLLEPLGVKSWEVTLALITGFIAKELILSTIVIVTGNPNPLEAIASLNLGNETLVALMIFIALYVPCLATVATVRSESRSFKLALATTLLSITVAYITSTTTYLALTLLKP